MGTYRKGGAGGIVDGRPNREYDARMSPEAERLLEEALKLSDEDREVLAVILEDGVGDGSTEEEREAAWGAEIQRRLEAVRAGEVRLIPWEEVQRELEAIVARGRVRRGDG